MQRCIELYRNSNMVTVHGSRRSNRKAERLEDKLETNNIEYSFPEAQTQLHIPFYHNVSPTEAVVSHTLSASASAMP